MDKKYISQKLPFASEEEIAVILSDQKLQETIKKVLLSNNSEKNKTRYIAKLITTKKQQPKKASDIEKLASLIHLPPRTIRYLKKIYRKDRETFLKLNNEITNIASDPSKDHMTKLDRIKKLLQRLSHKRKSGIKYNTYYNQQILTLVSENPNINRKQMQEKMQIEEKTVIRNVKKLVEKEMITEVKVSRKYTYIISKIGQLKVNELTLSFLNRDKKNISNTHFKNDSVHPKQDQLCSEKIAETRVIDKKLRLLGIYAPRVREFLEKYSLGFIAKLYEYVIKQVRIENKGAYIYKVLSGCPKSRRIRSFVDSQLKRVVSKDVCDMFVRETKELDINICLWLGNSLKRLARKMIVEPCNVHTALHNIYKKVAGVRNENCSVVSGSYTARNKKHEEILVKIGSFVHFERLRYDITLR